MGDVKPTDKQAILKQVEFYFGDNNLPYDKFLWTETRKNDGWIPIKTIHSFKRMRQYEPFELVVEALRESPALLEVSEDGEKVRRRTELTVPDPSAYKARLERTVYAKGFGDETETLQRDIEAFFEAYGPTNQVRLRRTEDGTFKSSVFAEFASLEDAKKVIDQDPKPKFGETELLVMSKQAYVDMKSEQHNFADRANGRRKPKFNAFKELRAQENKVRRGKFNGRRGNGRRHNDNNKRRSRDDEDAPEAKKPRAEDVKSEEPKQQVSEEKTETSKDE